MKTLQNMKIPAGGLLGVVPQSLKSKFNAVTGLVKNTVNAVLNTKQAVVGKLFGDHRYIKLDGSSYDSYGLQQLWERSGTRVGVMLASAAAVTSAVSQGSIDAAMFNMLGNVGALLGGMALTQCNYHLSQRHEIVGKVIDTKKNQLPIRGGQVNLSSLDISSLNTGRLVQGGVGVFSAGMATFTALSGTVALAPNFSSAVIVGMATVATDQLASAVREHRIIKGDYTCRNFNPPALG